jgi:hypothetical protein
LRSQLKLSESLSAEDDHDSKMSFISLSQNDTNDAKTSDCSEFSSSDSDVFDCSSEETDKASSCYEECCEHEKCLKLYECCIHIESCDYQKNSLANDSLSSHEVTENEITIQNMSKLSLKDEPECSKLHQSFWF